MYERGGGGEVSLNLAEDVSATQLEPPVEPLHYWRLGPGEAAGVWPRGRRAEEDIYILYIYICIYYVYKVKLEVIYETAEKSDWEYLNSNTGRSSLT